MRRLLTILGLIAVWLAPAAAAQPGDPSGRWAIRSDGRALAILELRRDADAPGGWTGDWITPERLVISPSHLAIDIGGGVTRRSILSAQPKESAIGLTIESLSVGGKPSQFLFQPLGPDHAELGWGIPNVPPTAMVRADPSEQVDADWPPGQHPLTTPRASNAEMKAIFEADQAIRLRLAEQGYSRSLADEMIAGDEARRARTLELLNSGALRSGEDYWHAAFVFQHGGDADDYLLAHTLAIVAAARGRPDATWIASATLDRYLQTIGQKQIYGTQYLSPQGQPTTQEPYDRTLVSDALRRSLRVPPQAEQDETLAELNREREAAAPKP